MDNSNDLNNPTGPETVDLGAWGLPQRRQARILEPQPET
jgi:hypothetical protein